MENNLINNIEVGERIRNIREGLDMTRESFSEMIDVSDVFLGQIERGERSLSLKTLCRITSFTGMNKINKILLKSSDLMLEYAYKILIASYSFFKKNKIDK